MNGKLMASILAGSIGIAPPLPAAPVTNPTVNAAPIECGRACLSGLLGDVLAAMPAHDAGGLPLAPDVTITENGFPMPLFDGLWQTASAVGRYRLDAIDPDAMQAGTLATVMENGAPVLIALRIRVAEQKIVEIETLVARGGGGGAFPNPGKSMEDRGSPRAQFLRTVPQRERMDRADLIRTADLYFANLQASTGKTSAPFAPGCNRIENGSQTTNLATTRPNHDGFDVLKLGCEAQQRSGFYPFVTSIRDRRFPVVDRERGLVLAFGYFDHNGTVGDMHLTNGRTIPAPVRAPLTFQIAELFQIDRGKIDQVEAVLNTVPYRMKSPVWDKRY